MSPLTQRGSRFNVASRVDTTGLSPAMRGTLSQEIVRRESFSRKPVGGEAASTPMRKVPVVSPRREEFRRALQAGRFSISAPFLSNVALIPNRQKARKRKR